MVCSLLAVLLVSCNVQERIVFNDNMGGRYENSFDLSAMMSMTNSMGGGASNSEKETKKIDTVIVFSDILVQYKDSIATLSSKERAKIEQLKDFTMAMKMDQTTGEFKMDISKDFKTFRDIERVSYELDQVLDQAKTEAQQEQQAGPGDDLLSLDKVVYTFENNTFRRTDLKRLNELLENEGLLKEETRRDLEELRNNLGEDQDNNQETAILKGMMDQFGQEFENSTMRLEYVFPRKVVSVSPEGAVISEDGKTVTFEVSWKDLLEENKKILENFEVILEDK